MCVTLDDTTNDSTILQFALSANRHISLALRPHIDDQRLAGSQYWQDAANTTFLYFHHLFEHRINNNEKEFEMYLVQYRDALNTLIKGIKADRPRRTKTVLVTDDPRKEKLRLPSQRDIFIFGNF